MAFGIEIINNNDRILIDNNYPNFGFTSTTTSTVTPGGTYPGIANTQDSDLIAARANTSANGVVGRSITTNTWATTNEGAASSTIYYRIRRFDNLATSQPGYGVEVYANTGNVLFTSNITKNFEIVAAGTLNSFTSNTLNVAFPSSNSWYSDFSRYFVVVNNTVSFYLPHAPPYVTGVNLRSSYRYIWANSSHGRILFESFTQNGDPALAPRTTLNRDAHYMILKELA